jgi:hypothetical protein
MIGLNENVQEIIQKSKNVEIIDYNSERCIITFLGQYEDKSFVLKLCKKEYSNNKETMDLFNSAIRNVKVTFENDIYYKFIADDYFINQCKADFIYPADSKVIDKYRKKDLILFRESYEIYLNKTKLYIYSIDPSHTKWIHNVLFNDAEEILLKTDDFVILRDYKGYDENSKVNCLGIPFNKDIKSLRDLCSNHLDLLKSFYDKVTSNLN